MLAALQESLDYEAVAEASDLHQNMAEAMAVGLAEEQEEGEAAEAAREQEEVLETADGPPLPPPDEAPLRPPPVTA